MKRVLVTGATGFIGRHALRSLAGRGYEVHGVARAPLATPDAHWHRADLLNPAQPAALLAQLRPTHLLHFAWYAEHGRFWSASENFAWVTASQQLLDHFVANGGRRFVGVGSCAEYDWRAGLCREYGTPLAPATLYGTCKDLFRRYLDAYAGHHRLSAAWGRVFHLFGPGEHPGRLTASVIDALRRGEPALCTSGEQVRDFMHVADVADAFAALLDSDVTGAVNVASGQALAIKDLVLRIAGLMQRRELVRLGALPPRADDPPVLTADTGRLNTEVGWHPARDLDARLTEVVGAATRRPCPNEA